MLKRLNKMNISNLVDMLWWSLEQETKGDIVFKALQKEIQKRVHSMRDEDLLRFLQCFTENSTDFSVKLLKSVVNSISKKLTKFQLKTQVGIIWSFGRLNLQSDEEIERLFMEIKEIISKQMTELSEKSIAMLMWSYSKEESPDQMFLEKLKACVSGMKQPKFDNFDLTLIVQSCNVFEGSFLKEDVDFMSSTMNMMGHLEHYVIKEVKNLNIHQFMTIAVFYLRKNIGSSKLLNVLKNSIVAHMEEFDRIQLTLLRAALQNNTLGEHDHLISTLEAKIEEINSKETAEIDEEKLRMMIREKLIKLKEQQDKSSQIKQKLGIDKEPIRSEKQNNTGRNPHESADDQPQQEYEEALDEKVILKNKFKNILKTHKKPEVVESKPVVKESNKSGEQVQGKPKSRLLKDYLKNKKKMEN